MNSSARLDELHRKFQEDPRRYFAPLANELRKSGDARRAVDLCREQLAARPGHLSGRVVLALALHDLGAREEARAAYQEALQLDPENVLVLRSLGDLARESGEPVVARDWYERAMGIDPRDPEVARRLAALERDQEDDRDAPGADGLSFTAALAVAEARHRDELTTADDADTIRPLDDEEAWGLDDVVPAAGAHQPQPEPQPGDEDATHLAPAAGELPAPGDEANGAPEEFTAGFFATGLDEGETPAMSAGQDADQAVEQGAEQDLEQSVDEDVERAGSGADEDVFAAEEAVSRDEPEIRAAADPGPDADEVPDETVQVDEGSFGTELAAEDGAVPDLPSISELEELPTLDVYHDGGQLEEIRDEAGSPDDAGAEQVPVAGDESTESPDEVASEPERPDHSHVSETAAQGPAFVTETMAQLYLQQGLTGEALVIYRQLAEQRPDEPHLRDRVDEIERSLEGGTARATDDGAVDSGGVLMEGAAEAAAASAFLDEPPAASWLQRLATARPGGTAPPGGPSTSAVAEAQDSGETRFDDAMAVEAVEAEKPLIAPVEGPGPRGTVSDEWVSPDAGSAAPAAVADESEYVSDVAAGSETHAVSETELVDEFAVTDEFAVADEVAVIDEIEPVDEVDVSGEAEPADIRAHVDPVEVGQAETVDQVEPVEEVQPVEDLLPEWPLEEDLLPDWPEPGQLEREGAEPVVEPALPEQLQASRPVAELPPIEPAPSDDDPWIFEGERLEAGEALHALDPVGGMPAAEEPRHVERDPEPVRAMTLDELFARDVPVAEEQAAGALAAATLSMQDDPEVNAQLGEAAAEDPASLPNVLRGTPRSVAALRQGASFSFDQFFRVDAQEPSAPRDGAAEQANGPGGRSPDAGAQPRETESDLADFHAWLSGLSRP